MYAPLKKKYTDHNKLSLISLKLFADTCSSPRRCQALMMVETIGKEKANGQREYWPEPACWSGRAVM